MVLSPDFRLIRVTELPGDREWIKVEYAFEPTESTGGNAPARSGMVVLDAKRYWMIREAETKACGIYGEGSLNIVNEFTDVGLPVPFVSRCTIHVVIPKNSQFDNKRYEGDFVWNIDMHDSPGMDTRQFTLTAFGLPEPDHGRSNWRRVLFALFSGILLLICVLVSVRRRLQRNSVTS